MFGKDFPISEYYKENILDGITISRGGNWWSAVLLIEDPKTQEPFISIYKWQRKDSVWKIRKNFKINNKNTLTGLLQALQEFEDKISSK